MNRKLLPSWMLNNQQQHTTSARTMREETEHTLREMALVLKWTRQVREEILATPQEEVTVA